MLGGIESVKSMSYHSNSWAARPDGCAMGSDVDSKG